MRLQGRKRERERERVPSIRIAAFTKYEIRDGTSFDRRIQLVQFENGAFPLGIIIRTAVGSRLISRTSGFPYSLWDILEGLSNREFRLASILLIGSPLKEAEMKKKEEEKTQRLGTMPFEKFS